MDLRAEYFNDNLDVEEFRGEDWTQEKLPQKYPRLWRQAKDKRH